MTKSALSFSLASTENQVAYSEQPSQIIERIVGKNIPLLKQGKAVVESLLDRQRSFFQLSLITEATPEILQTSPDIVTLNLPNIIPPPCTSLNKTIFSVDCLQGQSYMLLDLHVPIDSSHAIEHLESKKAQLEQTLLLWAQFPWYCQQLIHSPALESPRLLAKLCDGCLKWAKYLNKERIPKDFFEEAHRFFLATDADFKEIRTSNHMARLLRSHYIIRKRLAQPNNEARLIARVVPSHIQVPFGNKHVVGIVVCLKKLHKNEQFDHRHILQACKRCLPSLTGVPRSFYTYRYPKETSIVYHIECEKAGGAPLLAEELSLLRKDLESELLGSIERVMSHIDIPWNEEEMVRNMILLLTHIRTKKDPTNLLLQFHGQTSTTINFHASIVRALKSTHEELTAPPSISGPLCQSVLLNSYTIEKFQRGYHKQGLMYSVQCPKEAFLRKDRSIDFPKARQTALQCIEESFGQVRDINGGLLRQQTRLLKNLAALLSEQEMKLFSVAEDLLQSIAPGIMKNFLHADHLLRIFRLFLSMKNQAPPSQEEPFIIDRTPKTLCIGFIRPDNLTKEEVATISESVQAHEHGLAVFHLPSGKNSNFCLVLCTSRLESVREDCLKFLSKLLQEKQRLSAKSHLRLCIPHLPTLLDPRLVKDRASSALIDLLYQGLMRLDNNGIPQPAVAKEVVISNNRLTYTFTLKNTYWSNGQPVLAHDFVYAWKKILNPDLETPFAFLLYPILNARAIKQGNAPTDLLGVYALSNSVLEVHLEVQTPDFLERVCQGIYSPLLRDIDEEKPGWALSRDAGYLCNGPFAIKKQKYNGPLYLVKNELYPDRASITLEGIEITAVENARQAYKLFKQQQVDLLGAPLYEVPLDLLRENSAQLCPMDCRGVYFLQLNMQTKLLQSLKIRRALSLAIDRKKIVEIALAGKGQPTLSLLPKDASLTDDSLPFDTNHAIQLFEEGLKDLSFTKVPRRTFSMHVPENEIALRLAQSVAEMWKEFFGLKVSLYSSPEFAPSDTTANRSYDLWMSHWLPYLSDPLHSLEVLCDPTNALNYGNWVHQGCQHTVKQAIGSSEPEYRSLLTREAEKIFLQELPCIPLCESQHHVLHQPYLGDVTTHPIHGINYAHINIVG